MCNQSVTKTKPTKSRFSFIKSKSQRKWATKEAAASATAGAAQPTSLLPITQKARAFQRTCVNVSESEITITKGGRLLYSMYTSVPCRSGANSKLLFARPVLLPLPLQLLLPRPQSQSLPRLTALPAQLSELSLVPEFAPPQKHQAKRAAKTTRRNENNNNSEQHMTIKNN